MEMNGSLPYLPRSDVRDFFLALKMRIGYRVWKRKLAKYGGFNKESNVKILDVGCGTGYFLRCVEIWFPRCELYGLDLDESMLNFASKYLRKAKLMRNDAHILPYNESSFDVIVALQVIEHLVKPVEFFSEACRVLRPEGFLLLATPNPSGIPARVLKKRWHSYRNEHISLATPHQWREVIKNSGFQILEDGATGLTGFRTLQIMPFSFLNWIPLAMFGFFPWYQGESYMAIAKKM